MPATIIEKFDTLEETKGTKHASAERLYVVQGTEDDSEVRTVVESNVPLAYLGLPFEEYTIKHLGNGIWDITVRYGADPTNADAPFDGGGGGGGGEPQGPSFSFDTSGGTTHITQSLKTVGAYAPPGKVPPNFKGAIGVTTDSVEGTDITIPVYAFTETHYIPNALMTGAYKAALFFNTGKVNGGGFKGFAKGEVLFLGASGSRRGWEDWEVTFRFAASPNVEGLKIGDIEGIDKRGWEYLWVRYADAEDEKVLVKQPIAVYVEQVYEEGDFSGLGVGT